MANINEILDSINEENVAEKIAEAKSAAKELDRSNKQLYARAKKAEGFENKDGKWVKAEKPAPTAPAEPEAKQPSAPDYGKLAYLKSEGVSHPDDRKIVLDEATRLNLPIEEVLGMAHIKAKLGDAKTQREAEDGMPSGKSGKSGGSNKGTVEHWVDKKNPDGTYQTPSDPELAGKVIDARLKQETKGQMFDTDHLYTG